MSIHKIEEPYRSEIVEILKSESDSDKRLHKLKLFMLGTAYFKTLPNDAAWLAHEINKQYSRNR
jgi:hypothetical protein